MIILSLILLSTLSGIYFLMVNSEIKMSEEIMDTLIENHKKNIPVPDDKMPDISGKTKPLSELYISEGKGIINLEYDPYAYNYGYGYYDPYWYYGNGWWNPPPPSESGNNNNNGWGNGYWNGGYWGDWGDPNTTAPSLAPPPHDAPPPEHSDPDPENTSPAVTTYDSVTSPPDTTAETTAVCTQNTTTLPITEEPPAPVYTEAPQTQTEYIENQTEVPVTITEPITTTTTSQTIITTVQTTPPLPPPAMTEKKVVTTRYNGNLIRSHIFAELGRENEVLDISYQYFFRYDSENTITDESYDQQIRQTIREISESGKETGKCVINSVSYRYKMTSSPHSKVSSVIFLDRSIEISTLNRLLIIFVIIGCAGLIIVFFISLFLANWAIKPIEDAWNKQKQFIADASHELKTPLTVIAANTDVVLSTPNDMIRNQERWLRYIKSETLRMSKLVNELLYIAKSDANEIKMDMNEFDISNTVSSICLIFESLVFEANRELATDISPHLKFFGDEDRIKQLVTILLDNATKYSLINSVISVSLFKNNQGKIKICISNKCEDLSEDNVSKLFDRFYRVDTSRNSGTGGNGLGLNIAQNIAEAHNGNIHVSYNYGIISFTVTL